jgi:hypothetical protein
VFFAQVNITELETLRREVAALKVRLTETTAKDLSLVTLVQNPGTMKLEEAARVFMESAPEIRGRVVSWTDFKNGRPENTRRSPSREREKFPHSRKFQTGSAQTDISSPK